MREKITLPIRIAIIISISTRSESLDNIMILKIILREKILVNVVNNWLVVPRRYQTPSEIITQIKYPIATSAILSTE